MKTEVLLERFPYRYVQCGTLEINGMPDYRIQKVDSWSGNYRDMYLCDNEMQLMTAMEDHDYTCWLDPANVPAYRKDSVTSYERTIKKVSIQIPILLDEEPRW